MPSRRLSWWQTCFRHRHSLLLRYRIQDNTNIVDICVVIIIVCALAFHWFKQ
jgi:hypothetical protein